MSIKSKHQILATCLWFASLAISSNVLAVGGGTIFAVNEALVPGALAHAFQADSADLTYHACTTITTTAGGDTILKEVGFFWVSSYQDAVSVVDSQINHFLANGYHIYGKYDFEAKQVEQHSTVLGERRDYEVQSGSISLFLDPDQNTTLALNNCQLARFGANNDTQIGFSNVLVAGEKSEMQDLVTDDLANGDFELRFVGWNWVAPPPIVPFPTIRFVFNANVTELNGPLDADHETEGSGNLFWKGLFND